MPARACENAAQTGFVRGSGAVKALARHAMHRRLGWLALVAMAFVVAMPMVSRVLPMASAMPGMAAMARAQHVAMGQSPAPDQPDDPLQRCAYCVLLAHSPALGAGIFAPLLLPIASPAAPAVAAITTVRVPPAWSAPARGPPELA